MTALQNADPNNVALRADGVFTAAQALADGYTREEIRNLLKRGLWRRLRRGVYVSSALYDRVAPIPCELHLLHCAAVRISLARPLVLSHWSAARLHRLNSRRVETDDVFGTDPDEARTGRGYRLSGAQLPSHHITEVAGWKVTTAARTVVDLARVLPLRAGVVVADSALRLGLANPESLRGAVLDCGHFEGIGQAARTCGFADAGSESPLESESRVELQLRGVPKPELQHSFYDSAGFVGRTDMYWEDHAVVGEADGKVKYTEPYGGRAPGEVLWAEKRREDRLRALGLAVIRWSSAELNASPAGIVERFWAAANRGRVPA